MGNRQLLFKIEVRKPLFCHYHYIRDQMIQKEHEHIKNTKHDLQIVLIAENIRTPENAGMMMRLAEAYGVEMIFFVGEQAIELTTKVKRASRNTYKTMKYEFVMDAKKQISQLKDSGYHLLALEITDRSIPIQKLGLENHKKIMLLVGSERQGISEELLQLCHHHFHIPMFGENSSINVVNALAIGLFKLTENYG